MAIIVRLFLKLVSTLAGAFVVFGAGAVGYFMCDQPDAWRSLDGWATVRWFDYFYSTAQHFALAHGECETGDDYAIVLLYISKVLAAVLLGSAVIRFLFTPSWQKVRLWTQARFKSRERHILIGYGALNQEVARERLEKGVPLTIVARMFDEGARDFAAQHEIILVERDVRDREALKGLYLGHAQRVIIALGDDTLTMETAQQVSQILKARRKRPRPEDVVFAHFTNSEVLRQLQLTSSNGFKLDRGFTGFAIREETARYLFARTWLAERATRAPCPPGEDKPRLHVVVVGAGDLGMAMVREAVLHGCSAELGPPKVTVVDRKKEGGKERFHALMPHLQDGTIPPEDAPCIDFVCCDAEDLDHSKIRGNVPVTAWIICCTDDATNLALAMRLEGEMRAGRRPPAPIYPRLWQGNVRDAVKQSIGQEDPWHLVAPFGGMQDVVPKLSFLDRKWMKLAKSIHELYTETQEKTYEDSPLGAIFAEHGPPPWAEGMGPAPHNKALQDDYARRFRDQAKRFTGDWGDLDDAAKLSSLSSAYQAPLRLWELGFDWKHRYRGDLPELSQEKIGEILGPAVTSYKLQEEGAEEIVNAVNESLEPGKTLGNVCAAEHRRFMVERAMNGWSASNYPPKDGAPARSNALKLHKDFRTYDDLFQSAKTDAVKAEAAAKAAKEAAGTASSEEERTDQEGKRAKSQEALDQNLRLLDAATLRGIMTALSRTRGREAYHMPNNTPRVFGMMDAPEFSETDRSLVVTIPDMQNATRADWIAFRAMGCNLRKSINDTHAYSLRLVPATPEVWTLRGIRTEMNKLRDKCAKHRVQLLVDHDDGAELRTRMERPKFQRPCKDGQEADKT